MIKHTVLCIMLLISLSFLYAKFTGFPENRLEVKSNSTNTESKIVVVSENTLQDTLRMEYDRPVKRLTVQERIEAKIASLDSLSFKEAYNALRSGERPYYLVGYLINKSNRLDLIKSYIDTSWVREEKKDIDIFEYSLYKDLLTTIFCSKDIWEKLNKEGKIYFLDFLIDHFLPKAIEIYYLRLSDKEYAKRPFPTWGISEGNLDRVGSFYIEKIEEYKVMKHGGSNQSYSIRTLRLDSYAYHINKPELLLSDLKILRKLISEEK